MERQNAKWFVNFQTHDGQVLPDKDFASLDAALEYLGNKYFEEPGQAHIDNANCCIYEGKISFIVFRCMFCKIRSEQKNIFSICIASQEAFEQWHLHGLDTNLLT